MDLTDALDGAADLDEARRSVEHAQSLLREAMQAEPRQATYRRVWYLTSTLKAAILDDETSPSLGDRAGALAASQEVLEMAEEAVRADARDVQAKSDLAWACDRLRYQERDRPGQSLEYARRAMAMVEETGPQVYPPPRRALIVRGFAEALLGAGKKAEARERALEAVAAHRAAAANDPGNRDARHNLVDSLVVAGNVLRASGLPEQAEATYRQAAQEADALVGKPLNVTLMLSAERAYLAYAGWYAAAKREADAREAQKKVLAAWSEWEQPNAFVQHRKEEAARRLGQAQ